MKKFLERQAPVLPRTNFPIVDVRDVAEAHVRAMTVKEAAGTHFRSLFFLVSGFKQKCLWSLMCALC